YKRQLQDPQVLTRFYIYEAYVDEQAVAFHKTTPHYKTCVEQLLSLIHISEPTRR
ncbi:antibiotic biosynthesis monooxygenase, partial [Klebsiella pneumoniae]|uniref:antibiotic biosynthesis monooxygenase n=1 Tax=Klebsiella pneumoniae TaxID=573 RepID=UPI0034DB1FAC